MALLGFYGGTGKRETEGKPIKKYSAG